MAYDGDTSEQSANAETQSSEIIKLLKAILIGIEAISGQEDLIDNVED